MKSLGHQNANMSTLWRDERSSFAQPPPERTTQKKHSGATSPFYCFFFAFVLTIIYCRLGCTTIAAFASIIGTDAASRLVFKQAPRKAVSKPAITKRACLHVQRASPLHVGKFSPSQKNKIWRLAQQRVEARRICFVSHTAAPSGYMMP